MGSATGLHPTTRKAQTPPAAPAKTRTRPRILEPPPRNGTAFRIATSDRADSFKLIAVLARNGKRGFRGEGATERERHEAGRAVVDDLEPRKIECPRCSRKANRFGRGVTWFDNYTPRATAFHASFRGIAGT